MPILPARLLRLSRALTAMVLLAGCTGVEAYQEDDMELGREFGRDLIADVNAGLVTWDEAHGVCDSAADAMRVGEDMSTEFVTAVQLGCTEVLEEAQEEPG